MTNPEEPNQKEGLLLEQIARMEEEMQSLEDSYGENMLNLTLAPGNPKVARFLNANHSEIFADFEKMATVETA